MGKIEVNETKESFDNKMESIYNALIPFMLSNLKTQQLQEGNKFYITFKGFEECSESYEINDSIPLDEIDDIVDKQQLELWLKISHQYSKLKEYTRKYIPNDVIADDD